MTRKHSKHLFLATPEFAEHLARLQRSDLCGAERAQAAGAVYRECYPYVAQQTEAFAAQAATKGVLPEDMEQSAALRLWRYVNRPAEEIRSGITPERYLRNAYTVVHNECKALCAEGSGMAEARLESIAGPFDHLARLQDEDAQVDGVLDAPPTGLARQLACPVPGPDEQVDLARQRAQVAAFAQKVLPPQQFAVLSRHYGFEDDKNLMMSFDQIAQADGVSSVRVQQVHDKGMRLLRAHLDRDEPRCKAFLDILRNA